MLPLASHAPTPAPSQPINAMHCTNLSPEQGDKAAHNFLSEAVVRSLPKGLTSAERQRVMASTPLSPTLNLLSSMPLVRAAAGPDLR